MIETINQFETELPKYREDVVVGMKGDANRVVREAKSLIGYLQELISRLPGDMKQVDLDDPVQYNAILRIVEAVEGSHRDMTQSWTRRHDAARAQLSILNLIADRLPKAEPAKGAK